MTKIPPPRPTPENLIPSTSIPLLSQETGNKVTTIIALPGKKRPFYPLWYRREMMKNSIQSLPFSEEDFWKGDGELGENITATSPAK